MFHNRKLDNQIINCTHERALRIVYQEHNSMFNGVLAKDGSFKAQDRKLHKLLIEIIKVKMKLAPEITN